jgi:transcriptional regulator with XRE-family HTH domain
MGFAERLGELLAERGISGRELARRVPCDRSYVSLLAQGRRSPSPEMAARIDQLLGAGGQLAALAVSAAGERRPDAPGYADAQYVDNLRASSQALVRLDTMYGGGDVLPLALRAYRPAAHLLAIGRYAPGAERDLQAATGEAGEVAAWAAFDADQQDLSRQLIHDAMLASRLAGDREMELFQLSHLAMQAIHLGRPAEALRIAEYVLDQPRVQPRVQALFELRKGRAYAQLGNLAAGLAVMDRALAIFADGTSPEWAWWVEPSEILVQRGMAHVDSGDSKAAAPVLAEAAASRHGRSGYVSHARLLGALVHIGDWAEAGLVIGKLWCMADMISSPRAAAMLRKTTRRLPPAAPPGISEAARELTGVLRS